MSDTNLRMGYIGSVTIGGVGYFMSGSSLNPTQGVEAPDLVAGARMRRGWVYGKVDPTGNVTGPLHENATSLWPTAFERDTITGDGIDHMLNTVDIEIAYYQGGGWKFNSCILNSLQISATAGEVVTFTADFAGKDIVTKYDTFSPVDCAKLMTWDRVLFSITAVGGGTGIEDVTNFQSVNVTINNNVQKPYAITDAVGNLYPVDLPCGVREITGSVSAYAQKNIWDIVNDSDIGADTWADYTATTATKSVNFAIAGAAGNIIDVTFDAIFHRPEGAGQTGLAVYTMNFTAVCTAGDD